MINLGNPQAKNVTPSVLDAPGGFAWWYIDAIDASGNGFVIIWSFGLPFLPGYLSAARSNAGQPARSRPSLNISVYQNGKRAFYLLQEYAPEDVELKSSGELRFGQSVIHQPSLGHVDLQLDCPIPCSQNNLRGELVVRGPPAHLGGQLQASTNLEHRWTPVLGPARLRGELSVGRDHYTVDTLAYHDRNEGTRRLDDLGIRHWIWGRLVSDTQTRIWYVCFAKSGPPKAWGIELLHSGEVRLTDNLIPILEQPLRGMFGVSTWRRVRLRNPNGEDWLIADTANRVDDGPFYVRTRTWVKSGGYEGPGLSEWIVPDRIDRPLHRPLVRMAVHRVKGPNSPFLPLFSGSRRGRLARFFRFNG